MDTLGLGEDELCRVLDTDPLSLLSGQLDQVAQLRILIDLLAEAREHTSPAALRAWVRTAGPAGRPIDALLARDFARFEDALAEMATRGFRVRRPADG